MKNFDYGMEKAVPRCPGTVFDNNGLWYWAIRLPGDNTRKRYPLRMPNSKHTMRVSERTYADACKAAIREWERATHVVNTSGYITVDELCELYTDYAREYYRNAAGQITSQARNAVMDVRLFREMYGSRYVADLTHANMLTHRDALIRSGICRTTVNSRINTVKRMFKWALGEAHIPPAVKIELTQVEMLKAHRSRARETTPVQPVDPDTIETTLQYMVPNTADMIRVHSLTGMRPDEMCRLRWSQIDTSSTPWIYRPDTHKNAWRNHPRVVCIGPRARKILEKYRDGSDVPFSPQRATAERFAAMRTARKTPVQPSQISRAVAHPQHQPGTEWDSCAYCRTIHKACERAGITPWAPNRLRHTFATAVRRQFGLNATRAILGHSGGCRITDRYSYDAIEDETIAAATAAVETLG